VRADSHTLSVSSLFPHFNLFSPFLFGFPFPLSFTFLFTPRRKYLRASPSLSIFPYLLRFGKVEHKITHVQSNTKFFLEVLNHQKSNKLEWIIIVLIAAEIVLSCIDLYHQILV